ncbi:hypothetical protein M431DRAFT_126057 [Trichoderma harzianum CBS 226.95]|uniref:HNH nuclease domain-containing protein n=1 Tax=Trichoderma harzianum CBS 226.95 TaxID=983964 RepID=A0A2T3ZXX4_TRIHA|nr:hypothetical protein M431DRAFT_126057 [Trichoderma harzianum CBS 226.95]PTB49664.1 hypothetical protein M431DRAFT_126057 [Trichoderma harzianum CBS 226.95]
MDETSDISDSAILANVTAFLAQGTESQKKQLCTFLRAQSSYMYSAPNAILPTEELAVKLGSIEELRKNEEQWSFQKPFHFSYIQLATLCLTPTETLKEFLHPKQFLPSVLYPEHWLNIRMGPLRHLMSHSNSGLCKLRDQRTCILTKAANPDVCRIMPSSVAENKAEISAFITPVFLSDLLGRSGYKIGRILLRGTPNTFEESWNMICLHPLLRMWWSECLFGLKCLGVDSNGEHFTVKIQFHWMPMNSVRPHQLVEPPYDKATSAMLESMASDVQEGYFHGLKSGQIFEIQLPSEEDAEKMKAALDVQWVAVRLAALSGAARSWEWGLGNDLYDDGDDDGAYSTSDVEDEE